MAFAPDEVQIATAAFDKAWEHLSKNHLKPGENGAELRRRQST